MNKEIIMNNTIKTIALSVTVAFLSSAALAGGAAAPVAAAGRRACGRLDVYGYLPDN